jgi:hypothetical protein
MWARIYKRVLGLVALLIALILIVGSETIMGTAQYLAELGAQYVLRYAIYFFFALLLVGAGIWIGRKTTKNSPPHLHIEE